MMNNDTATPSRQMPKIAVVMGNTLAVIGLKQLLTAVMRGLKIQTFNNFDDFKKENPDGFFHFFVDFSIVLENMAFFYHQKKKTIVLMPSDDADKQLTGFHSVCVNVSEDKLVKSLLMLGQQGHPHGQLPVKNVEAEGNSSRLSDRETEVLALVAQGYINKEIADRLNIALSTVISHRKNITDKLGIKSVSALTIYAVMNGYVDINLIGS
ncbi:MAG: helix-turn-helix transcriptional regulator [Prevotella sp.]|nr:helix-turn-helix transcriptional regulator [Prevotella sp.]